MAEITVRRAAAADAELLSSLNTEVQAMHAAALPWWFKPPHPESAKAAAAALDQPNSLVLIAHAGDKPAGYTYAEVMSQPETPWRYAYEMVYIHHLGVAADYRRQGVGTALLAAMRAEASSRGITLLALDVWTFNEEARAFFRSRGFNPYNERLWTR